MADDLHGHRVTASSQHGTHLQQGSAGCRGRVKEVVTPTAWRKRTSSPKVGADALAEREYDRSPGNTFNVEATLSWELDLWGKLRWSSQASLAAYLQTRGRTKSPTRR